MGPRESLEVLRRLGEPQGESAHFEEAGWAPGRVWTFWEGWVGPRDSLDVLGRLGGPQGQSEHFGEAGWASDTV